MFHQEFFRYSLCCTLLVCAYQYADRVAFIEQFQQLRRGAE